MIRVIASMAALVAVAASLSAQIVTIAEETFDYTPLPQALGSLNGGVGWENPWYSGGSGTDATVVGPGFDPVGGKAVTNGFGGSYRKPDRAPWPDLLDPSGKFGKDGTTFWFTFFITRVAGGDDQYGGFSLFEQFNGEKVFIGCTFQATTWGSLSYGAANLFTSVPGTSCDVLDRIVARIDHLPGQERLRLWTNPTVPHPITAAAVDVMIYDFVWDEIRIESGAGTAVPGYEFDGLTIEAQIGPLHGDTNEISTTFGGTQNLALELDSTAAFLLYTVVGTLSGTSPGVNAGPFNIPLNPDAYTLLLIANPNTPPLTSNVGVLDANGEATITLTLPTSSPSLVGLTAHHAGVVLDANGQLFAATNAVAVTLVP